MNSNIRSWHKSFCLLLLLFSSTALAGETSLRNYTLPDHGSIQFQVPSSWEDRLAQPPDRLPPTIEFKQKAGHPFSMLITPIWPAKENTKLPDGDNLRKSVQEAADRIASGAVEKKINLIKLNGSSAYGYYFSVTDSAPKPGEYKYLTQGHVRVGDLMVIFTILTNDDQDKVISDGLALIKSAEQNMKATAQRLNDIEIIDSTGVLKLTVPASRLVLSIPRGNLALAQNPYGGSAAHPGYFYLRDQTTNLTISGWFEPANKFMGVKNIWEKETETWKRKGLPEPQNIAFFKNANWDIIAYDHLLPSGSCNSHIKANWLQTGTWIDVHISMTSNAPSIENRAKLIDLLSTFEVKEKK